MIAKSNISVLQAILNLANLPEKRKVVELLKNKLDAGWKASLPKGIKNFSDNPFARAVITYCLRISSKNEFFVSSVRVAKAEIVEASTGSDMCQK